MHIDYTISEADYASAQKLAIKRMKPLQYRLTLVWLPAFGLLLLGFLFYTGYRQGFSTSLAPGFFVSIFFLSLWVTTKQSIRKGYAKSTNMHGQLTLDISDDGLNFRGITFNSQVTWDHFSRFVEDKDCYVLFQNPLIFNIVPKRCLSDEQSAQLRDFFAHHIGPRS